MQTLCYITTTTEEHHHVHTTMLSPFACHILLANRVKRVYAMVCNMSAKVCKTRPLLEYMGEGEILISKCGLKN